METLPADLFETYKRILERANNGPKSNRKLVERTLRWLVFAKEPMSIEQVMTAVTIEVDSEFIDLDDIPDESSLLRWCSR